MSQSNDPDSLTVILQFYQTVLSRKIYREETDEPDLIMNVFNISSAMKRENRQYWGRELGMCWQRLLTEIFRLYHPDFQPPVRTGQDEPCDFGFATFAVDTKYRIGSGDAGTLKKISLYMDASCKRRATAPPCSFCVRTICHRRSPPAVPEAGRFSWGRPLLISFWSKRILI